VNDADLRDALRCDRPRCACRRGRSVHCPGHAPDRSPSLAVDQAGERLLVHCYAGCDQRRVIAALQERRLWPSLPGRGRARARSPLEDARADVIRGARRQAKRLDPYREALADAEALRFMFRVVCAARTVVTALGPDDPRAWTLARAAADLERDAFLAELAA
jgi:hypothetical protein